MVEEESPLGRGGGGARERRRREEGFHSSSREEGDSREFGEQEFGRDLRREPEREEGGGQLDGSLKGRKASSPAWLKEEKIALRERDEKTKSLSLQN